MDEGVKSQFGEYLVLVVDEGVLGVLYMTGSYKSQIAQNHKNKKIVF